jgi:glycosyltransferase involved in cell wall biosynthesis
MTISVVVPTRAPSPYLGEALASLSVHPGLEVVVVEDGSEEASVPEGIRLIRLPYGGRSRARNAGVDAASGALVAFLDADDVALPDRLERQERVLAERPDAVLCFGRVEMIDVRSQPLDEVTEEERRRVDRLVSRGVTYTALLADCPIYTSATLVRRDAFLAAGGYDEGIDAYEDLDLYLRLTRLGALVLAPGGPVTRYRRHPGNTTSEYLYAGALRVTEKHLGTAEGAARRLLLERRVDCLWGLGDFRAVRREALRSLIREPRLLGRRRFLKRLAASGLPASILSGLRARTRP